MRPGATSTASNRMSLSASSGCAASQAPAAAAIRCCWRGKKRFGGAVERAARLHLDENQHATAARDDVDFADRASEAPRHDAVAFGDEIGGGAAFRREPDEMGGDALGPGLARRHFCDHSVVPSSSSLSASAR